MKAIFDEKIPIYLQIMNFVKMGIVTGQLKSGDKLPSVREASIQFKVNPNTLQRAYQELERQGIVFTQRGTGTFVQEDINIVEDLKREMATDILDDFIKGMKSLGFTKGEIINIISSSYIETPEDLIASKAE